LLRSLLNLVTTPGVTHVACAFDHVIESFRNTLYPGYKTSAGIEPELLAQFPLAEAATRALGFVVWPMVEFEADDALSSGRTARLAQTLVERREDAGLFRTLATLRRDVPLTERLPTRITPWQE
jgi:5'-3' exonuclease